MTHAYHSLQLHFPFQKHIKELVRQTATHIMNARGVVRSINSWGTLTLPQRMRRHGEIHSTGEYVVFFESDSFIT
jgi:small subunit ribosomal protein S6